MAWQQKELKRRLAVVRAGGAGMDQDCRDPGRDRADGIIAERADCGGQPAWRQVSS